MDTRRVVSVALGGKFQEQLEEQTVIDWLLHVSGMRVNITLICDIARSLCLL